MKCTQHLVFTVLIALAACVHAPAREPARNDAIRVMTYNIESGRGNLDGTVDAIRASGAKLVALQEVDVHWAERSRFVDQAKTLGDRLGMQVRFARIYHYPSESSSAPAREFGVALLSAFPIVAWTNHPLTRLSTQEPNAPPTPMPGFLEATVDVNGTRMRVFDTHLDYRADPAVRRQQVSEMLNIIGAAKMPTLLFGDLNATPTATELQPLLQRLHDVWPDTSGAGFTYPADAPVKRIDYVLTSRHFHVRNVRVPATEASDHRPVVAELVVEPQ